ncbi:nitrous oxide reductase family maturation protein NosD [Roseicella frigidaeris]|uniref:Nitrous oxide reductase family maturation protein NosD n=1 Tax=Roseicella frigidaeris TaxID=2230885 RepID=A0A327M3J9_9PROT|nr:nitrous oxide reductase family maturation protein NosD [Roseicella frigidaeris]RAI57086.1 nitrous oxide reductase family maturation protein NosD [Roseicella frigidaeris]
MRGSTPSFALLLAAVLATAALPAWARVIAPGDDLQAAIEAAGPGEALELLPGTHRGPVRLDRPVTLAGREGAILEAPDRGSVITVLAPGAAVRGLLLRGSGSSLDGMDSAVFLEQSAARAVVEGNRMEGNLFGVYVHGAPGAIVRGNTILGRRGGRMSERGDGISLWNAPGTRIEGNDIRWGRDGIFTKASQRNAFIGNRFRDLRFGVHYMYTNDSEVSGNASFGNHAGYAIMYSQRLTVRGNLSDGDRDHGLLFNYANGSQITGNWVIGRVAWARRAEDGAEDREHAALVAGEAGGPAPGKCVFIYNANNNRFTGNRFEGCGIGVHFTAGSEGNVIAGNAFIGNRNQVKYVGTRHLDWSRDGQGNYWSDNPAFDLNRDGTADAAYRPNDLVDRVLWTAPRAKLLLNSPAVQVLRWAQSQFPAILPGGVMDSHPLVAPPPPPEAGSGWRS